MKGKIHDLQQAVASRQAEKAATLADKLLRKGARSEEVSRLAGAAFAMTKRLDDAVAAWERAIAAGSKYIDVYTGLASIYHARHEPENMFRVLDRAYRTFPDIAEIALMRGAAASTLRFAPEAQDAAEHVLSLPNLKPEQFRRAVRLLIECGAFEEARDWYGRLLTDGQIQAVAWDQYANLVPKDAIDGLVKQIEEAKPGIRDPEYKAAAAFALARLHDRKGDYAAAFPHYQDGNTIVRSFAPDRTMVWQNTVAALKQSFPKPIFDRLRPQKPVNPPRDLFILGLPRSGTTLIEQTLLEFEGTHTLGESPVLMECIEDVIGPAVHSNLAHVAEALTEDLAQKIRGLYDSRTKMRRGEAQILINQLQLNFLRFPWIKAAFPDAVVVVVERDPMDVAWSIYQQNFVPDLDFAFGFDSVASFIALYRVLMTHWRNAEGGQWEDVKYEEFVSDHVRGAETLIHRCSLEPTKRLKPLPRVVETASSVQARREVTTSSVGKWRRYEAFLEPLRTALDKHSLSLPSS